jgi:uroporphyrinogen-III synthase
MNKAWTICVGEVMADRLNGYRILILETREEAQFSRLLTEQGADVLQCPMFTINDAPTQRRSRPDPAVYRSAFDDLVPMTGEELRLMKVVRRIGVEGNLLRLSRHLRPRTAPATCANGRTAGDHGKAHLRRRRRCWRLDLNGHRSACSSIRTRITAF